MYNINVICENGLSEVVGGGKNFSSCNTMGRNAKIGIIVGTVIAGILIAAAGITIGILIGRYMRNTQLAEQYRKLSERSRDLELEKKQLSERSRDLALKEEQLGNVMNEIAMKTTKLMENGVEL